MEEICETPNIYYYTMYIIGIIIQLFIIYTLYDLEKKINCECSNNQRKIFLKEWFIFIVILNIFIMIGFFISNYICYDNYIKNYMQYGIFIILSIINIIMIIRLFIYINWLRNECKCGYETKEKIIYYYLIITFIIIFITILFIIIMGIIAIILLNSFKNNKISKNKK